jgi:RNA-directed DNA polymerase
VKGTRRNHAKKPESLEGTIQNQEERMKKWYSLIDKIYNRKNLIEAYKKVKRNRGAPGIDGVTTKTYGEQLHENTEKLHQELRNGTYKPSAVKRVEIPKPDGSSRPLGIPTVRDRVVQQALLNTIQPIFEKDFHPSSYGYRPGRSCQQAIAKAERFMNQYGLKHVVDMDLSKCFDTLDHEQIIEKVNRKVSDGKVLKLITQFLKAGIMKNGEYAKTRTGSPQGGVCSPLLANIYLDDFDQKMKAKGIRIVRYADDILIFARSPRAAKKNLQIAKQILEDELKLTINRKKTKITQVKSGVEYLGVIIWENRVTINPKRIKRIKDKIRELTPRNHGMNVEAMIKRLNPVLRGWANYFRMANCKKKFAELMQWVRRRLRMKQMKEWKSWKALFKALRRNGHKGVYTKISMTRWRNSSCYLIHRAIPNKWFDKAGLINLETYETGTLSHYYE